MCEQWLLNEVGRTGPVFGGMSLYVQDVPAALEFFQRVFGFRVQFFDETFQCGDVDLGGAHVAFVSRATGEFLMPGARTEFSNGQCAAAELAFYVDDLDATMMKAVAWGATSLAEPRVMPWGATMAYLRGPEGILIGLCTPRRTWEPAAPGGQAPMPVGPGST
jgi:lactoylglutathione lyase